MAKISASVREALDLVAHCCMAAELDKNVPIPGFFEFYKKQLSASDAQILREFEAMGAKARRDLVRMLEASKGK